METGSSQNWKEAFARAADHRHAVIRRRENELERDRRERQEARKDRQHDDANDAGVVTVAVVLASTEQIDAFNTQLDDMDAALVEALTENSEALRQARARFEEILGRAHRLPDGRAVFRTEDGLRVISETGEDVTDIIAPDEIDPGKPTWEDFDNVIQEQARLHAEQEELLDYQRRVDEARERVAEGDLTADELDDLQAGLEQDMPEAVRTRLADPDLAETPEPATPATVNLDALRQGLAGATAGM